MVEKEPPFNRAPIYTQLMALFKEGNLNPGLSLEDLDPSSFISIYYMGMGNIATSVLVYYSLKPSESGNLEMIGLIPLSPACWLPAFPKGTTEYLKFLDRSIQDFLSA